MNTNSDTIRVEINGDLLEVESAATVIDAVLAAGAPPDGRGLAVAINGEVIPRSQWEDTLLAEGQKVEVVGAVQGG